MYPPKGHPISEEKARELIFGQYGDYCRKILDRCCAPIFWFQRNVANPKILHSGTVTFVKTPKKLIGITAAHVFHAHKNDTKDNQVILQLYRAEISDLFDHVIDISDKYDLCTIAIDEGILLNLGKEIDPLEYWPPKPPQKGRGIMIAGYPGIERKKIAGLEISFGLFTALVTCRTVTDIQITWLIEPEYRDNYPKTSTPPPNYNLGGVSGGPLISLFESENYIAHFCLSGIVTEHPDYDNSDFSIERLVAVRADLIREDGKICN